MFKKMFLIMFLVVIFATTGQADTWSLDKAHSSVGFSVRHLVISKTTGKFDDFTGTIVFDGKNFAAASVELTVQMASVDTDDEKRDEHLRSADFFETEKFPTMDFKSKKVTKGEGDAFTITGDLTIKGVTKEVTFDCQFPGVVNDPWGNTKAGFSAMTQINRQDFGVTWSKSLDGGGLVVGDDVDVMIEVEAVKEK